METDDKKQCRICLDELDLEKETKFIHSCSHCKKNCHKNCLTTWLKKKRTCPTCRQIDEKALEILYDSSVEIISHPVARCKQVLNIILAFSAFVFVLFFLSLRR
jgi:hypothetical protein